MRVLFMGTPEFACPSLEALLDAGHEVVGVVTRPDRPSGRGRKLTPTPVKLAAEARGLTVLETPRVNAPEAVDQFRALAPDVVVVVAFGAILKRKLLNLAPYRAVNVHASLLPAYRGVAPVQWALIHGRRNAGVTTMLMDEGVDTGPTFDRGTLDVHPGETAGELLERLSKLGGELLVQTLKELEDGTASPVPQSEVGASYAPRLEREHGYLDFTRSARDVANQFRGVTPAPGARVFLGEEAIRVGSLRSVPDIQAEPYTILEIDSRHLRVAAGEGAVDLLELRPAGKRDMEGAAFARGRNLEPGKKMTPPPTIPELDQRVPVRP